jgi:hypothetical protein
MTYSILHHINSRVAYVAALVGAIAVASAATVSPLGGTRATRPEAPQVTVGAGLRQLQFDWEPVPGAAFYMVLENPDGASPFRRARPDLPASVTSATLTVSVHRHDWANARYIVAACNRAGCTNSAEIATTSLMLTAIGYFKASNPNVSDLFGTSISLSADGRTLASGAIAESSSASGINGNQADNSLLSSGAAYVFTFRDGAWSQQAYIKASSPGAQDFFGTAVVLSADGNTLVVGAPGATRCVENCETAESEGAVYIFERNRGTWAQKAIVRSGSPQAGASFGNQVELSADGQTMAVNAPFEDLRGASYVFTKRNGQWVQQIRIPAAEGQSCENTALSGDGRTLAVGCSVAGGVSFAAIYKPSRSSWELRHTVTAEDLRVVPFALDLDFSGTALVGAVAAQEGRPGVVVFKLLNGNWEREAVLTHPAQNTTQFATFSPDGNTLVLMDPFELTAGRGVNASPTGFIPLSGAVSIFKRSGTPWELGTWTQGPFIKAPNPSSFDTFGAAVSMTPTADIIAIASPFEGSDATGIGGDQFNERTPSAGAIYLF